MFLLKRALRNGHKYIALCMGEFVLREWQGGEGNKPRRSSLYLCCIITHISLPLLPLPLQDPTPQGAIPLGQAKDGFKVWSSVANDTNEFTVRTLHRDFWVHAPTTPEFLTWTKLIKEIIDGHASASISSAQLDGLLSRD